MSLDHKKFRQDRDKYIMSYDVNKPKRDRKQEAKNRRTKENLPYDVLTDSDIEDIKLHFQSKLQNVQGMYDLTQLDHKGSFADVNDYITKKLGNANKHECILCELTHAVLWHHYKGYEPDNVLDVVPLCRNCHMCIHIMLEHNVYYYPTLEYAVNWVIDNYGYVSRNQLIELFHSSFGTITKHLPKDYPI